MPTNDYEESSINKHNNNMKPTQLILSTLLLLLCGTVLQAQPSLVPKPNKVEWGKDKFTISAQTTIAYADNALQPAADYLAVSLERLTGVRPVTTRGSKGDILLLLDKKAAKAEGGYSLAVERKHITAKGHDYAGVVAAIATLRQLTEGREVAACRISDAPRFGWRGFHLDCSRHFFTAPEVKEAIDLMALYKLNRFHWHLTDDQGWRIEIKRYPLLTERGAWRKLNNQDSACIAKAHREDNPDLLLPADRFRVVGGDSLYGGFYTQDDIREVVDYAAARGISIVPEVDMPGHCLSAITNYKGLSCFDQVGWGKVFTSPLCPGKDSAMEFCRNVWREVIDLFPYQYVHIGGDEVEKDNWKRCPDCQRRIKEQDLSGVEELQSWFIHQMEQFFNSKGRRMIGWDEIIEGGLSKTSTLMWWRTWAPNAVPEATAHGNDVIYTPVSPFYFSQDEEKSSMQQVYEYDLAPAKLTAKQRQHIIGVQGNLWAEGIPSRNRMLYMYFPRILALSELAWTQPALKNFDDFYARLRPQLAMLNRLGVPYRIPSLDGFHNVNAFTDKGTLTVECKDPQAVIRYTTDGSFPNAQSPRYEGPITVDQTTPFTLRTFTPSGRADEMVRADFIKQGLLPALQDVPAVEAGVRAEWYDFAGSTCKKITTARLNGTYTTGDIAIPEACKGNIGLVIKGYIRIPADGVYTFALLSDDGSWLKIDGNMVVDNDREQSPHEVVCQQALAKGYHYIEARYFDHNGGVLRLNVLDAQGNHLAPQNLYFHASEK